MDPANTKNFQSQQNLQTDVAVIVNFSHYELTDTVSVLSNLKTESQTMEPQTLNVKKWFYKLLWYLSTDIS